MRNRTNQITKVVSYRTKIVKNIRVILTCGFIFARSWVFGVVVRG